MEEPVELVLDCLHHTSAFVLLYIVVVATFTFKFVMRQKVLPVTNMMIGNMLQLEVSFV